jgi:hypothetical protein
VFLDGGADDDHILFFSPRHLDTVSVSGGAGNDRISVSGGQSVTIDAGDGNDFIDLKAMAGSYRISLGAGRDVLTPQSDFRYVPASIAISDFETGDSGDRIDLLEYLPSYLIGWDFDINPFGSHLRLVQEGADTVLQLDRDGAGGVYYFADFIRFANTTAPTFVQSNLGGYPGRRFRRGRCDRDGHCAGRDPVWRRRRRSYQGLGRRRPDLRRRGRRSRRRG